MEGKAKSYEIYIGLAAFVFSLLFTIPKAQAQVEKNIFISELMWQGSDLSTADEWIELENPSENLIDLSGYYLCSVSEAGECLWKIEIDDGQVAPSDNFLISNYDRGVKTVIDIKPDLVNNDIMLSNSKLRIELRNKFDEVVDRVGDGKKPFWPESSSILHSMQRVPPVADGTLASSWIESAEQKNLTPLALESGILATPSSSGRPVVSEFLLHDNSLELGKEKTFPFSYQVEDNDLDFDRIQIKVTSLSQGLAIMVSYDEKSFVLPAMDSCPTLDFLFLDKKGYSRHIPNSEITLACFVKNKDIKFSEILTSPKDNDWDKDGVADSHDEWFEIVNLSSAETDLANWTIKDKSNKSSELSGRIAPNSFLVFYYKDTFLSLNNSGEVLYLIDPSGEVIDTIDAPKLDYNESFAQFAEGWLKTILPSPGFANTRPILEEPKPEPSAEVSISEQSAAQPEPALPEEPPLSEEIIYEEEIETIVKRTVIYANLASHFETVETELNGVEPLVLGATDERAVDTFKNKQNLLYSLSALLAALTLLVLINTTYEIYRLE